MTPGAGPALEDRGQLISFLPSEVLRPASVDELGEPLERIASRDVGGGLPKAIAFDTGAGDYLEERVGHA